MAPMRKLTGLMAGAGRLAAAQAEAWRRIQGVRITAVSDTDVSRAEQFASARGIPRSYPSAEAMLDGEGPADFLDIATPPDSHAAIAALAASRRLAAICQAPPAADLAEAAGMVAVARRRGSRLLVHENRRWQPGYREIRRLLDRGKAAMPPVLRFRMRTGDGAGPEPYADQPRLRELPRLLIRETAVHFIDTFRYLAGEIVRVRCRTSRRNPVIRGEDQAFIEMEFESGARGEIDADRTEGPVPAPPAFGTLDAGELRLDEQGGLFLRGEPHAYPSGGPGDGVRAAQEHLVQALRTGEPCELEAEAYLGTLRAVEGCYRSAAEGGRTVDLRDIAP